MPILDFSLIVGRFHISSKPLKQILTNLKQRTHFFGSKDSNYIFFIHSRLYILIQYTNNFFKVGN